MHQKMMNMYAIRALVVLYLLTWTTSVVAYHQLQPLNFTEMEPATSSGSFFFYPVTGNVYPLGRLTVTIGIGLNPTKPYVVGIDTGSDLTWVACADAKPTPSNPYSPKQEDITRCQDIVCSMRGDCASPSKDPCEYTVTYADATSCSGILVRDSFPLRLRNGTTITPRLKFGCGTPSFNDESVAHQTIADGILGLGKGDSGILKQLREMGVNRSVAAHCFSAQGGGSLFIGDIPAFSGMTWKQLESSDDQQHYYLGKADILLDGQATDIKGLEIFFDSGITFTYLISPAYQALLDQVTKNLNGSPLTVAPQDYNHPICWGASKPIKSIGEVTGYFKPLALNFVGAQNVLFEMGPESYLIISDEGNVCLGILDAEENAIEEDMNVIGDISMHDKLVIYDNENEKVGWATENCTRKF